MEVLIEKKMIDIKSEPVELAAAVVEKPSNRRRSNSTPTELEPCEEFPILYGLLTAPKSFKPKNSEELHFLPLLRAQGLSEEDRGCNKEEKGSVMVTSRVQLVQCSRRKDRRNSSGTRRSQSRSSESAGEELEEEEEEYDDMDDDGIDMEEADSQNLDFCRSSSNSPQTVDSSSNMSVPDENNSPIFLNYLSRNHNNNSNCNHDRSENSQNHGDEDEELDGESCPPSRVGSPGGGSTTSEESNLDDNIPTSTTSGFRRKACRLEHAIGNIVKRRRVQKRPTATNNNNSSSSSSNNSVPISMAPSSPTVSTTCVDPPTSQQQSRGRSEILERILRSNTTTTNTRSADSQSPSGRQPLNEQGRRGNNDDNNNNESGSHEPFAKLRDLLTMPEDQLVKRRRLEYGISENKVVEQDNHQSVPVRRREFSPPRNNILASLLQKGRAPYDHISSYNPLQRNSGPPSHSFLSSSINKISDNANRNSNSNNQNDERPYKCSLCDLRFKKLPLLNRHVKTHSHIKRYVCRFCSHAFKRSDNLLAHMRTSCKGIKEHDTKFATGGGAPRVVIPPSNNNNSLPGQIIPQLLSAPPAGPLSPMVSRSQLEEALLNLSEKRYVNLPASSPLVSTTTGSPPPPKPHRRQIIQPGPDFQSKHSKLLEILSGSPVVSNSNPRFRMDLESEQDEPLPLSLKIERRDRHRAESPPPTCSSSSPSPNQSQFLRSHLQQNHVRRLYSNNKNELPLLEEELEEVYDNEEGREIIYEEEENDNEQPLDLGRHHHRAPQPSRPPPVPQQQLSARSRDHPEIVSILSRQPKNVMMLGPDLRKLVGIDAL